MDCGQLMLRLDLDCFGPYFVAQPSEKAPILDHTGENVWPNQASSRRWIIPVRIQTAIFGSRRLSPAPAQAGRPCYQL